MRSRSHSFQCAFEEERTKAVSSQTSFLFMADSRWVAEVDGDTVHEESPVEAHARTSTTRTFASSESLQVTATLPSGRDLRNLEMVKERS